MALHTEKLRKNWESYELRHDNEGNATHAVIKDGKATIYASLLDLIQHRYFGNADIKTYSIREEDLDELYGDEYNFHKLEDKMKELQERENVDLFSRLDLVPKEVRQVLNSFWKFAGDVYDSQTLEVLRKRLETFGYTFDYGLDLTPFNLRKFGSVEI